MRARRVPFACLVGPLGAVLALPVLLGGCASLPPSCVPPARPMLSAEMFFGRGGVNHNLVVSEEDFATFVAAVITPLFPDGLTVLETRGQWRDSVRATIARERSKLVKIIFADDPKKRADLDTIAAAYKRKFHQQSVLISLQSACVAF